MTLRSWLTKLKTSRSSCSTIRADQKTAASRLEAFMEEQCAANAKLEAKFDKLNIEIIGVKGRVRRVEEAIDSTAL
jgi:hypothetical protein